MENILHMKTTSSASIILMIRTQVLIRIILITLFVMEQPDYFEDDVRYAGNQLAQM